MCAQDFWGSMDDPGIVTNRIWWNFGVCKIWPILWISHPNAYSEQLAHSVRSWRSTSNTSRIIVMFSLLTEKELTVRCYRRYEWCWCILSPPPLLNAVLLLLFPFFPRKLPLSHFMSIVYSIYSSYLNTLMKWNEYLCLGFSPYSIPSWAGFVT